MRIGFYISDRNSITEQFVIMTNGQLEELSNMLLNKHTEFLEKSLKEKSVQECDNDILFTIDEACKFMRITRSTLHKWGKEGTIPQVRKGGRVFYRKSDIMGRNNIESL